MTQKVLKFSGSIETVNVDQLIPYELNNKIHHEKQINALANIIGQFGYLDEIIVDKNFIIISGHGRLESIKKMGYDAVEVKVLDIDAKNSKQLRILHNKIAEYDTNYDLENLEIEIEALGRDDKIDFLDIEIMELFPELQGLDFDPEQYEIGEGGSDGGVKKVKVIVELDNHDDAEDLKLMLEDQGYSAIIN